MRPGASIVDKSQIRIGLNVPIFIASLLSLGLGIGLGLVGVWAFIADKTAVPQMLKVIHAHTSWWSIVILIFALLLPTLPVKKIVKKFIVLFSFFFVPLYVSSLFLYYGFAKEFPIFAGLAFGLEILFFAIIFVIGLLAVGFKLPLISSDKQEQSKYDILSDIYIPSKVVGVFSLFLLIAVILGWYILLNFTSLEKPIRPSALVQFHTHIGFFAIGFLMAFLAINAVGAEEKFNKWGFRTGLAGLVGTFLGLLIFILGNTRSLFWVVPAMVFYAFFVFGLFCIVRSKTVFPDKSPLPFIKGALIFIWSALLIFIIAGPYLSVKYDTNPNVTITYKQPQGTAYPGPYPEKIIGTAPVKGTPRGIENFHLSPGSWSHVAIFWLIVLMIAGEKILTTIGRPNLIFLLSVLIVQAPFFNAIGRIGAWADLPGGIGPLFLVAQPLKAINIILLLAVGIGYLLAIKRSK